MYVREKKIRKGIGTWDDPIRIYSYWQVVRSTRVDGKPRQKVVAHIGGPYDDKAHAERAARSKGILCGAIDCPNLATVELEHEGFKPTVSVDLLQGRKVEVPFKVCAEHLEAWRRRERFNAMPRYELIKNHS